METSVLIARVIGVLYLSFGLGTLLSKKYYQVEIGKLLNQPFTLILVGFLATLLGVLMVSYHNMWNTDWTLIITLVSWLVLAKGVLLIILPGVMKKMYSNLNLSGGSFMTYISVFALIGGLFFTYLGFVSHS